MLLAFSLGSAASPTELPVAERLETYGPAAASDAPGWHIGPGGTSSRTAVLRSGPPGSDLPLGGTANPVVAVNPLDPQHIAYASHYELRISTDGGASFGAPTPKVAPYPHYATMEQTLTFDSQGRLFWAFRGQLESVPAGSLGSDAILVQCDPLTGAVLPGYPVNATALAGYPGNGGITADMPCLTADQHPTSPYRDRLYLTWVNFQSSTRRIQIAYSSDQGMSWTGQRLGGTGAPFKWPTHVAVAPGAVAPGRDVYVVFHKQPGTSGGAPDGISGGVIAYRSTDGGVTFSILTDPFPPGTADMTYNVQSAASGKIPNVRCWLQGSVQPWVLPDPNTPGRLYVVAADDPDNDVNAGDPADVFLATSTDYGVTWTRKRIDSGPGTTLQCFPTAAIDPVTGDIVVHYFDTRRGLFNGDGYCLLDVYATVSRNGGVTFGGDFRINDQPLDPEAGAHCRYGCLPGFGDVWASAPDDVFVAGSQLVHYDGANWVEQLDQPENMWGIWGSSGSDVFAVGDNGSVYHYDGSAWSGPTTAAAGRLFGVHGNAWNDVYAVGLNGALVHFDGSAWSAVPLGTTEHLVGIWTSSPYVFVAAQHGTIHMYDGSVWTSQPIDPTTPVGLIRLWGTSPGDVYAVGFNGAFYHYDGAVWTPVDLGTGLALIDVWQSSASDVHLAGNWGSFGHYDGSWTMGHLSELPYQGIGGSGPNDVWAVSLMNRTYHYDGSSWSHVENPIASSATPTLRVGPYNSVASAGGKVYALWCGNEWDAFMNPTGQQSMLDTFDTNAVPGAVSVVEGAEVAGLVLKPTRPNPSQGSSTISYTIPGNAESDVVLRVYDAAGRLVRELVNSPQPAGRYSVTWDGTRDGAPMASGVYFCELRWNGESRVQRIVLLR